MKNILVTGGAGFIGSNFIAYFLERYLAYQVINLDKLTYAGSLDNLVEVASHPRYCFVQGDIVDTKLVHDLFKQHDFQGVIHLAAESHVDKSIQNAESFIKTNLEGTFVLINAACLHWMERPQVPKAHHIASRFLHVSTDEVYGTLGATGFFTESTPYAPNNPYSATKAGSDLLVRSYVQTYGLNAVTTHCSNNYGPKQHDEKLIPTIIRHALAQKPIPIHGEGMAIRDWIYVLDHCKGIDLAFHRGQPGEHYNLGGSYEQHNLNIANRVCSLLDEMVPLEEGSTYKSLITFVPDRLGNDQRYALDTQKATKILGWGIEENFESGLRKTLQWYINKYTSQGIL